MRSPRAPCAPAFSQTVPMRAARACAAATPPGLPPRGQQHLAPRCMPSFRLGIQKAKRFNKPLSFDTSSVTDMNGMFLVRSPPARPGPKSDPPRVPACMPLRRRRPMFPPPSDPHLAWLRMPPRLPVSASRPASHAPLSIRQFTYKFNQLLSFDTSSVTDMKHMFGVCALWPPL